MTKREPEHTVYGRPGRRQAIPHPGLDDVASRGLLTWWDVMSDLDPDWLTWSEATGEDNPPNRRVA
jgi:hypothetical protein